MWIEEVIPKQDVVYLIQALESEYRMRFTERTVQAILAEEERIKQLHCNLQQEVSDFVDFLIERRRQKRSPTFSWAGALEDMRNHYDSVELQHQAADWRLQVNETAH